MEATTLSKEEQVMEEVKGVFDSFIATVKAALNQFIETLKGILNAALGIMPLD